VRSQALADDPPLTGAADATVQGDRVGSSHRIGRWPVLVLLPVGEGLSVVVDGCRVRWCFLLAGQARRRSRREAASAATAPDRRPQFCSVIANGRIEAEGSPVGVGAVAERRIWERSRLSATAPSRSSRADPSDGASSSSLHCRAVTLTAELDSD
jgi:hypothetical protein